MLDNTFTMSLPNWMTWKENTQYEPVQTEKFKKMKSEDIAKCFFESLSKQDFKTLKIIAPEISDIITSDEDSKNEFKDLKIY